VPSVARFDAGTTGRGSPSLALSFSMASLGFVVSALSR
jgi:hypothetical protein